MGEYYSHLYTSTQELVDAQNYCALKHLQYFKVFLVKKKRMLQPMKDKDWLTIAKKNTIVKGKKDMIRKLKMHMIY